MSDIVATLLREIALHRSDVNSVCFYGTYLATGSADKTVRVFETDYFIELPTSPLIGHTYYVNFVTFAPNGTVLASSSTDGKVIFWDYLSGQKVSTLQHKSNCAIRTCIFSPNGQCIATAGDDDTICIWSLVSLANPKLIKCLEGHESMVVSCSFSPNSMFLVSGSTSGDLMVWDAMYGHGKSLSFVLCAHDLGVTCSAFSPTAGLSDADASINNFLLATGGNDNLVKMWHFKAYPGSTTAQLTLKDTLAGHSAAVMDIFFSFDGRMLASASGDQSVRLWHSLRGDCLHIIEGHSRYVTSCAFSCDAKLLATGSNDKTVKIWLIQSVDELSDESSDSGLLVDIPEPTSTSNVRPSPVSVWNVDQVCRWIESLGFAEYSQGFRDNAIDGAELLHLNDASLRDALDISALGHRNKILRAIDQLKTNLTSANQNSTSNIIPSATPHQVPVVSSDNVSSIPDEFLCPITREVMRDPVIAADGYTYERKAIFDWMKRDDKEARSPMTNAVLSSTKLVSNHSLRMLIHRFHENSTSISLYSAP